MLHLLIILLLVSNLPCIYGTSTAKKSSNELQIVEKQGMKGYTDGTDIRSEKPGLAIFRTKTNGESASGKTLEACFGSLGRWLKTRTQDKQDDPARKRRCLCECYKRLSKEGSIKIREKHAANIEHCCSHIKAGGCAKCSTERNVEITEFRAGDLKLSSLSFTNNPTESRHESNSSLNVVSGNVQHRRGPGTRRQKTSKHQAANTVNKGSQRPCCWEKFYDDCFVPSFLCICGLPLLCLANTFGQCFCDQVFHLLDKCCLCR